MADYKFDCTVVQRGILHSAEAVQVLFVAILLGVYCENKSNSYYNADIKNCVGSSACSKYTKLWIYFNSL